MAGGNFGHHDTRIKKISKGKIQFLLINIQHNWHLATHYPSEFFWGQSGWVITGFGKDSQGIEYMSIFVIYLGKTDKIDRNDWKQI